jgi:hypothetical protein
MDEAYEQNYQLRALAMRVAALEDNVAYLERWCEEQQDTLDRAAGPIGYDYEVESGVTLPPRAALRVVDLRDSDAFDVDDDEAAIVAFVETDDDRRAHQIRVRLNSIRTRLAASLAPGPEIPAERPRRPVAPRTRAGHDVSAKPAGRTAP